MTGEPVRLIAPARAHLDQYADALAQGWSPDNTRDVSAEQLVALPADPEAFLADLVSQEGEITLWDGRRVPKLPSVRRWIWDGSFCGVISLRHQPGTEELPDHVLGHIGYAVVPWKRRRGYATAALRLMLDEAAALGLARVMVNCSDDNIVSRRVIMANRGVLARAFELPAFPGETEMVFWVPTRR
jgi:predicted acetyltransferase